MDVTKPAPCRNSSVHCPLCDFSTKNRSDICRHFTDTHDLSIKEEAHDFTCSSDFLKWKQDVEKMTKSLFVKVRGTTPLKCVRGKKDIYVCHRSGKCRGKLSDRVRHPKSQGSPKLNAYCPARMKVVVTEGDRVFLNFLPTHVGHGHDTAHLKLLLSEREMIAKKIVTKQPMDQILEEAKCSPEPLSRLTLLNKQDLYNISRDTNLLASIYSKDEIDVWASDPKKRRSILLFKPHGVLLNEIPALQRDDFILCLLNDEQKTLFHRADWVSLDYFKASSPLQYNLFYIACIVGTSAAPISFMISNRQDLVVLKEFLKTVKSAVGGISPQAVFSEDDVLYEAWKNVFSESDAQHYGSWQIESEWRGALSELVKTPHRKIEVYKRLKLLLNAPQESEFAEILKDVTSNVFCSDDVREFESYFKSRFLNRPSLWSKYHRSPKTTEIDGMFEKLFKTVKFVYIRFKMTKTVCKMGDLLLDVIRQCELGGFSVCGRLKSIKCHHKTALESRICVEQEDESCWRVSESDCSEVHVVEKTFASCRCRLKCVECRCCPHDYNCSCGDSSFKKTVCKHVHAVCLNLTDNKFTSHHSSTSDSNHTVETVNAGRSDVVINDGIVEQSVEEGRLEVQDDFNTILSLITTIEDVNLVKNAFRLILPTLYAMKDAK